MFSHLHLSPGIWRVFSKLMTTFMLVNVPVCLLLIVVVVGHILRPVADTAARVGRPGTWLVTFPELFRAKILKEFSVILAKTNSRVWANKFITHFNGDFGQKAQSFILQVIYNKTCVLGKFHMSLFLIEFNLEFHWATLNTFGSQKYNYRPGSLKHVSGCNLHVTLQLQSCALLG